MEAELTTTKEVITALGGSAAVAEITGRRLNAVSNWRKFSTFPSNTYTTMQAALIAKGKSAPDALWGMSVAEKESAA